MKGARFSLNPYAASYVPLHRRGAPDDNKANGSTESGYPNGNQTLYEKSSHNLEIAEDSIPKGNTFNPSNGSSSSQNPNEVTEKKGFDEEYEMDMAYLSMTFPGISDESLADVYKANNCDLEATVDMLNELENSEDNADVGGASGAVSSTNVPLQN